MQTLNQENQEYPTQATTLTIPFPHGEPTFNPRIDYTNTLIFISVLTHSLMIILYRWQRLKIS